MSISLSLVKPSLKTALAEAIYNEILTNSNNYYYFLGKPLEWTGGPDGVVAPQNTLVDEGETRKELVFLKKITTADIAFTVPRYDWNPGEVFDMYDDALGKQVDVQVTPVGANFLTLTADVDLQLVGPGQLVTGDGIDAGTYIDEVTSTTITLTKMTIGNVSSIKVTNVAASGATALEDARFYCITNERNVYKCLFNNNGAPSTVKPYSTTHQTIQTSDGYVWKYMYTIPNSLVNKFQTLDDIPVTTALKSSYYSRGSITSATVINYGTGYEPGDQLIVTGDGHLRENTYRLLSITVADPGFGYTTAPTVTVSNPYDAITFQQEELYVTGQYVKIDNRIYEVLAGGLSGVVDPTYTGEDVFTNGTLSLQFVGYVPVTEATLDGSSIDTVSMAGIVGNVYITYPGSGYDRENLPNVTIVGDGLGATANVNVSPEIDPYNSSTFQLSTVYQAGEYITVGQRLYQVMVGGTTDDTYPAETDPMITFVSGTATLRFVGYVPRTGYVKRIKLTNRGEGYVSSGNLTITIDPPELLELTFDGDDTDVVSIADNTFTFADHGLITGDEVIYNNGGGSNVSVGGLTDNANYYVVALDTDTFKLTTTLNDALSNINFVDVVADPVASGSGHTFTKVADTATAAAEIFYGFGYNQVPSVQVEPPFEADSDWSSEGLVDEGDIVEYGRRFYEVTSTGSNQTLGIVPPSHDSGTESNGEVELEFIGRTASLTMFTEKTKAILTPVIENGQITNVIVQDPGVGYTTADIQPFGQGEGAVIVPNLSFGDINTRQANTELLSVPGTIDAIQIINPGLGYTWATVTVTGDGVGCTAEAILTQGAITKIVVTNPGFGYTRATVTITGNNLATPAYARAIISPPAGHGKDAIKELLASDISLSTTIARDRNQGFLVENDYRQLGIIKNPNIFGSTQKFTGFTGSACYSITGGFVYDEIEIDMTLTDADGNRFQVVALSEEPEGDEPFSILVQAVDNKPPRVSGSIFWPRQDQVDGETILSVVVPPSIDKYSGEVLFVDNRSSFQPTDEQTISIKTVIRL